MSAVAFRFRFALCLLALACLALFIPVACSSSSRSSSPGAEPSRPTATAHVGGGDHRSLDELVEAELARKPIARTSANPVPAPPGVEPGALAFRATDDPRAFLSLDQALAALVLPEPAGGEDGDGISRPEIAPEQQAAALHAYVKARNAALDNRHLQAVTEYLKAYAIDPTSPHILREMARSYDALGNPAKALELLEQLVQVEPGDSEAIFAIGIAAGNRRDFTKAVQYLGEFRALGKSSRLDPATEILTDFTLALSLRELGYDRASIEIGEQATGFELPRQVNAQASAGRLASVYRQRGDTWRAIGDAHCRLGEFPKALAAYNASAALPTADPSALHPRIIYADLSLGRVYNAQRTLLQVLREGAAEAAGGIVPPAINDRDVRLCAYLAQNAQPVDHLAQEVIALHEANPQNGGYVRAAALLLPPDRAVAMLRSFIDQRPADLQAVSQLLEWVSRDDLDAAAALTVGLAGDHPDMAHAYANRLAQVSPNMARTIEAVERQPASPSRSLVQSLLLFRAGSVGGSWVVCQAALQQWPDDRSLRLRAVELSAAMREPALANKSIAACGDIADAAGLITLAQARRAMNQTAEALQLAQRALESEPQSFDALVEVARAHHARGLAMAAEGATAVDSRAEIDAAIATANRAIELDPARDDGYQVLEVMYGAGGALADERLYREVVGRLGQANPQSPLYARLTAEEARDRGRFDTALERAVTAYDGNPADGEALALAVDVWSRANKLEDAERWLREQLTQRPGDASLREQLLVVQVRRNQSDRAIAELEAAIAADDDDWIARRLLETVYRASGQPDSAMELGEQRLLERPEGVRRETELAALYAGAERADPALAALERVRDLAADASLEDLAGAITIAGRIRGEDARREAVTLGLVNVTIERFPAAPLQVYGVAMRALSTQADSAHRDEQFDDLVKSAIKQSKGANDPSIEGARLWHDLCQALVGENEPAAAARAMRVRLDAGEPFDPRMLAALVRMTVALDAAATYDAEHERNDREAALAQARLTMDMLSDMESRGVSLQRVFETPQPIDVAAGLYEASVLYNIVGCEAGSEFLLREAVRLDPKQAMALNNLGYMLLERGDEISRGEEVASMIEQSHALQPLEHNILDTIGWLRYKQGRFTDETGADGQKAPGARTLVQQAIDGAPDPGAEVFDHLGDVCWRLGDESAAVDAWSRVVRMLSDGSLRENLLQNLAAVQTRQWQMIVMDGERLYDREYAPVLERAQAKIEAAKNGGKPAVAPIWNDE